MEAIKIEVTGNIARVIEKPAKITSGTVGLPVEFTFDSQWEGLSKIAVFKAGHISRDMPVMDGATAVPMEVLAKPNVRLNIGVYGVNEAGSIAIPTIWENAGKIYAGAVPDGNIGTDFGVAQKQYDEAVLAAEKADASAKKAEADASVAENAADRADAFARSAADSATLAGEEAEYAIIECTQLKNAAINARHYAEEAAERAAAAAERAESAEDIIIDVAALPETDINKHAFYRLLTGSFMSNGEVLPDMYCYVVEELPEKGTPVLDVIFEDADPDPANHRYVIWLDGMHIYHNLSNGEQYAYLDNEAAGLIGGDPGWRILDDATVQAGHHYIGDYGGLLTTSLDDASPNTTYLVLHEEVYYYHYNNGGFVSISDNTGGGGSITVTDDGNGNVTITASAGVTITDDGNGNVTIE